MIVDLDDGEVQIRKLVATSLLKIGPSAIACLAQAVEDEKQPAGRREQAAILLGQMGDRCVDPLSAMLRNKSPDTRAFGAIGLWRMGPRALPELSTLLAMLSDDDSHARGNAGLAIGAIGEGARSGVHALAALCGIRMKRSGGMPRWPLHQWAQPQAKRCPTYSAPAKTNRHGFARKALLPWERSARARDATATLITLLKEKEYNIGAFAAEALGKIGPDAKAAVPELSRVLRHGDAFARQSAACALSRMHGAASDAVPALCDLCSDFDTSVRAAAIKALGKLGGDSDIAIETLTCHLHDDKDEIRCGAVESLGRIGPKAAKVIPVLRELLGDPNSDVRSCAAKDAISRIGGEKKSPDIKCEQKR